MRKALLPLAAALCLAPAAYAAPRESSAAVRALLEKVDSLYRSGRSRAELEMEVITPDWSRKLSMDFWTEGLDKTFIRINSPARDAGAATLRKGGAMWNYFPKINKVMKVPPSMMLGSWMGSDFTNDDLVKESTLLDDYYGEFFTPEKPDPALHYIKLKPRQGTVSLWAAIELAIRKSDLLPVREDYYDEKGRRQRTMEFSDVAELGGRTLPRVMRMVPLSRAGHSTTIRYKAAQFDGELPADTFTLRNLQRTKIK
ncbi:MAG: outer membrane lipoprotein-sorting protein [Elusimicrobia bacterium CG08_land_8_20_14_0_20_59_10]|nr:MAG: outer membrane lipoprotein-sorting protein [Elusimicrobia bacterium CG08_land_8_20_14_0_20_59_10]